jgi:hypothetical protein
MPFLSGPNIVFSSSVGIALGYELDDRCSRVRFPVGAGNFSLHHRVENGSGAHPEWVPGALSLRVKRPGREADHSPPSSAEVKECVELYFHTPITPSWCGAQLKHRDNFTFYLTLARSQTPSFCVVTSVRRMDFGTCENKTR